MASWQLPQELSRQRIITGFRLFYKKRGLDDLSTMLVIRNTETIIKTVYVSELAKYTEYEFQVLAFTSAGDGPKSSLKVERTKEDGKELEKSNASGV